jgi:hypothetical protein
VVQTDELLFTAPLWIKPGGERHIHKRATVTDFGFPITLKDAAPVLPYEFLDRTEIMV